MSVKNGPKAGKPMSKKLAVQESLVLPKLMVVKDDDCDVVKEKLMSILKKSYPCKPSIDWISVRRENLSRKQRREKIREMRRQKTEESIKENQIDISNQKYIDLGFNKVIKNIRENISRCIIVSSSFPVKCLQIIIDLSHLKSVAIIGVEDLDSVTRSCLGFSCSVVSINSGSEHDDIKELSDKVIEEYEKSHPISSKSAQESGKSSVKTKSAPDNATVKPKPETPKIRDLHLKRTNNKKRVFVPTHSEISFNKNKRTKQSNVNHSLSSHPSSYQPTILL